MFVTLTTTPTIEGRRIVEYKGIVFGEVISGVDFVKDFAAGLTNFFGGRSNSYEGELQKAREQALAELQQRASAMGANAVVGVDLDYETLGANGSMLMVTAGGIVLPGRATSTAAPACGAECPHSRKPGFAAGIAAAGQQLRAAFALSPPAKILRCCPAGSMLPGADTTEKPGDSLESSGFLAYRADQQHFAP